MSGRLEGKVALVTGSGRGIGKGIADVFASEGADVVYSDIDFDTAQAAAEAGAKATGRRTCGVKMDVSSEESVNAAMKEAKEKLGVIDILVCNAGVQHIDPVHELSFENWRKVLSIHLDGSFLCTKAVLPDMYEGNRGGSIIYMGSIHSHFSSVLKAPYCAAKHGILGLCRTVAKEGGPHNVRANTVCPGFVRTELVEKQIPLQAGRLGISEEDVVKKVMLKDTVDGEFSTIEDVAEVCVFFASHPTQAITGQSIVVSHGWHMS